MIREAKDDPQAQKSYLNLLRGWFKNSNFTPKAVAAAYMTGILPIKKDGSQSAISDFDEYSILNPGIFTEYTGFLEREVRDLCAEHDMDYQEVKDWYDGYDFSHGGALYNPYSVMNAIRNRKCRSYWGRTSAAEAFTDYINMDFHGLQEIVARLIAGEDIPVNTSRFQNDLERFKSKDDVLTLLIHLGYLTYDDTNGTAHIPNAEVREEFKNFLNDAEFSGHWLKLIRRSQKLLNDTIAGNESAVAEAIEEIRSEQYAPQYYNKEQDLRAIIKYAYFAAYGQYVKIAEMPYGKGIADVVFVPEPFSRLPAMMIELKWNKTSGDAVSQMKEKKYASVLKPFAGNVLLVGINYDEKSGKHTCAIERA